MKKLTKVQLTYIGARMDADTPDEIASELGLTAARVRKEIEALRAGAAATPQPPVTASPKPQTAGPPRRSDLSRFEVPSQATGKPVAGVAVMTPQQSMQDDANAGTSPFGSAQVSDAVLDYIRRNMDTVSLEKLAQETGLAPFQVRNVIDHLKGVRSGREQFWERHHKSLHKIRPDEPVR